MREYSELIERVRQGMTTQADADEVAALVAVIEIFAEFFDRLSSKINEIMDIEHEPEQTGG